MRRALLLLGLCSCTPTQPRSYYQEEVSNTNYRLAGSGWRHTPHGVSLWDPRHEVQDARIDEIVDGVQKCAESMAPTREEMVSGRCPVAVKWMWRGFRRDLFEVAIAPYWYVSSCTGKQMFPCGVSKSDCDRARLEKGLEGNCSCACRGTIQDNRLVVVTPNLELLPGRLFQLVTGCSSPWQDPFATCTAPPAQEQK